MKLLGRDPHPQEVFYYEGRTCDDEIDVESILSTVQVRTGCWFISMVLNNLKVPYLTTRFDVDYPLQAMSKATL